MDNPPILIQQHELAILLIDEVRDVDQPASTLLLEQLLSLLQSASLTQTTTLRFFPTLFDRSVDELGTAAGPVAALLFFLYFLCYTIHSTHPKLAISHHTIAPLAAP